MSLSVPLFLVNGVAQLYASYWAIRDPAFLISAASVDPIAGRTFASMYSFMNLSLAVGSMLAVLGNDTDVGKQSFGIAWLIYHLAIVLGVLAKSPLLPLQGGPGPVTLAFHGTLAVGFSIWLLSTLDLDSKPKNKKQ